MRKNATSIRIQHKPFIRRHRCWKPSIPNPDLGSFRARNRWAPRFPRRGRIEFFRRWQDLDDGCHCVSPDRAATFAHNPFRSLCRGHMCAPVNRRSSSPRSVPSAKAPSQLVWTFADEQGRPWRGVSVVEPDQAMSSQFQVTLSVARSDRSAWS
jgi:hypothetical protein